MRRSHTSSRPHRRATCALAVVALVVVASACAKPKPVALGLDRNLAPQLAVVDSERPPRTLMVTLAESAYVAVLAVFPGRGATLFFPRDTAAASVLLPAGLNTLRADSVRVPSMPDSAFLRPLDARRAVDSAARARDRARSEGMRDREIDRFGLGPDRAHLMIFASRSPIDYRALARRLAGVSIPIETTEALSTVAKMARVATTNERWAAQAIEVALRR
jgi:hypothetical protein